MIDGTRKLFEDLKREIGHGTLKTISLTIFVDASGKVIGRTEFKTKKIFPRTLGKTLEEHGDEIAEILSGD